VPPRPEPETPAGQTITGGQAASFYNAPDIGRLLIDSDNSLGIQNQFRSAVITDPRIRGYHVGQITTYGDGGFFVPARLDLDTLVSKFDPTLVRDIQVIKGPYSVRYGPGFSFLDIATFDSPRSQPGTFELHERTLFGYSSNGQGLHALQMFAFGAPDWGVRATYDFRVSNDYKAGDGFDVPSSYNSQTGQIVAGFNLNDCNRIEFKAVRLYQHDVEFPGLFFDLNRLDTEAYSLRYMFNDPNSTHKVNVDLWYNFTGANGDTHQGAKQTFVNQLINSAFMTPDTTLQDHSNTNFSEESRGYRLGWGLGEKGTPQVYAGTDLNIVSQRLEEHIRLLPTNGFDATTIGNPDPFLRQELGIPVSRAVDFGFFLDGSLPVGDRLVFRAGLRADWVRTSSDPRSIGGNIFLTPNVPFAPATTDQTLSGETTLNPQIFSIDPTNPELVRHFDLWSGYITGEYNIDEHLSTQFGFGHAERPPTLTELYSDGPFVAVLQQGLNRLIGDPRLAPERVNQFDLGFKARWEHVRAGVAGFYAWIHDYITYDQNKGLGSQLSQVVFTNTDEARLAGGEMYLEVDAYDYVTPFGTVSYVQGRDLTHIDNRRAPELVSSRRMFETEPLPGIPPLEVRCGIRLHDARRQPLWAVEVTARTVFGQHEFAASLNELPTPGFTVWDLRGYWQATPNLLLVSGVENFGDKFYREHLDPRAGDVLFRPGANFYFTAQVNY
jgi:outer membrane receptor protein involved in Fe transport